MLIAIIAVLAIAGIIAAAWTSGITGTSWEEIEKLLEEDEYK